MSYKRISPQPVVEGGTGVQANTSYAVLCGGTTTTNPIQSIAGVGTSGQLLTSNGAAALPTFQNAPASSITITGDSGGGLTGNSFTFTGGTTGLTFAGAATTETLGGTLAIANGGTNATSMANTFGVNYYDGTRIVTTAVGTATHVLTSNGAGVAPTFQAAASGGITTINGNSGSVTGSTVTISTIGEATLLFSGSSTTLTLNTTDGSGNVVLGNSTAGTSTNTIIGASITTGTATDSVAVGNSASVANSANSVAIGAQSSTANGTSGAIAIGWGSVASANNSICLGNSGVASHASSIVIGSTNSVGASTTVISNIQFSTVTGSAVLVSASDQLGVAASSQRFKNDIQDMGSTNIMNLRPVTFVWNKESSPGLADATDERQYGLIAEEVHQVMPQLVNYDRDGNPFSVKYEVLPAILLNEIQKLQARIAVLEAQ